MDQQKEINKLLSFIKTRTSESGSQEDLETIVKYSYLKNIPIYATFVLIKAFQQKVEKKATATKDGWINISYENKIKSLEEEIIKIKKSKVLAFPVFDKKWKKAFLYSSIGIFVLAIILFVNILLYNKRTQELATEKDYSKKKTQMIDVQKSEFQNTTIKFSNKVLTLSDSLKIYKEEYRKLLLLNTQKTNELKQVNIQIIALKDDFLKVSANAKEGVAARIKGLEKTNDDLRKKIEIYELQINRFKEIGFNVGEDIEKINTCDLTYSENSKTLFDVLNPVIIRSVKIKAKKEGPATFYLLNNNNIMQKKEIILAKGVQVVDLGFNIWIPGAYCIEYNGVKIQSLKDCFSFPYSVKNLIRLNQCDKNQYSFFNWRVAINV